MERNRIVAKESRRRKQRYIKQLEHEVQILRAQVGFYKSQLRKYELIERYKNIFGYEAFNTMAKVNRTMQENNQPLNNMSFFTEVLKRRHQHKFGIKRQVFEILTKEIVHT